MRWLMPVLLLAGCAAAPGTAHSPAALRSSSSSMPDSSPAGPGVYTPPSGIAAPAAGISRRCVPLPSGTGADCRAM